MWGEEFKMFAFFNLDNMTQLGVCVCVCVHKWQNALSFVIILIGLTDYSKPFVKSGDKS